MPRLIYEGKRARILLDEDPGAIPSAYLHVEEGEPGVEFLTVEQFRAGR